MASTIKVDNVQNQPGTNIVNKCGTTVTVGAASDGIRSAGNNLQASDGGNLISQCGTDITLGASGDTITLASGASQTGFGREGSVDWVTTPKTSTFTGVSGKGYFIDSGSALTCNLPAGTAGDIISFSDYARNFATYNFSVSPDGSEKIGGMAYDATLNVNGQAATFVYVDAAKGWINVQNAENTETGTSPYVVATGGDAIATCGNFKTHIFTGPGTFCVSVLGTTPACNVADYLVVGGGGGGGGVIAGGGGAGGFRMSNDLCMPAPTTSPLACGTGITLTASPYSIAVGGGGPGNTSGSVSTFSTVTSAGGGASPSSNCGGGCNGASGSGGNWRDSGGTSGAGTGNQPPVSPPQGNPGGTSSGNNTSGGGGGAAAPGTDSPNNTCSGPGGAGSYIADAFVGPTAPSYGTPGPASSTRYFAGGGGGSSRNQSSYPPGTGGVGGGGDGGAYEGPPTSSIAGTINTGGGGGGNGPGTGNGGSGVVMIRYRYQ
jgi:hypothetical protein